MNTYNLGRILPVFKGNYASGTAYGKLDLVYVEGKGTFVANCSTTENPINSSYWTVVSKDGSTGAQGEGISEAEAKTLIESYDYTTMSEVEAKGYLTEVPSEYVTETELDSKGYLTEHQDISGKADKSEIPTKTSELTNDSGFLTEHQSLDGYATETWVEGKGYLTEHQDISGKADKSEIPTKTSELTNDSGFLTEHQSLDGYATETWVEGKGYLTEHQSLDGKQDVLVSGTNIKTINNNSILGEGNINIESDGVYVIDGATTWDELYEKMSGDKKYTYFYKVSSDEYEYYYQLTKYGISTDNITYIYSNNHGYNKVAYIKVTWPKDRSRIISNIELSSLISGTTIKTINSQSIVGSGNLTIESGISEAEAKTLVEGYNYTTMSEVEAKGYLTEHLDISGKADKSEIPTKTSELTNDSGFLTEHQSLDGKQDVLVSGTNIKTINNESILGEGNITIEGGSGVPIYVLSPYSMTVDTFIEIRDIFYASGYKYDPTKLLIYIDAGLIIHSNTVKYFGGTKFAVVYYFGNEEDIIYYEYSQSNNKVVITRSIRTELAKTSSLYDLVKVEYVTQSEYDALETKDETTLYIITDAQ